MSTILMNLDEIILKPKEAIFRKKAEAVIESLRKRSISGAYVDTGTQAVEAICKMIPDGSVVALGGSVTIMQIGSTPARFAALTAKGVDASIVWFPVTEIAKSKGFVKLLDLKEVFPEWPYETFAAKESWLNKEKATVTRFLRAYQRGVKHTLENKEDGVKAIQKYVKMDPAYAPLGYDEYRDSFPINGRLAEKAIPVVIEQEFESGRIKRKITLDELVDHSFMSLVGGK